MDNKHNKLIPSFFFFNKEFKLGNCLIDIFSDRFSFYLHSPNIKKHMEKLDNITFRASSNTYSLIIVSDASIKNHVVTSISDIHSHNKLIIKTIHRAINVTTTEAKLFAIQCGINQVVSVTNINYIVIIMDSLHTTKRIFNSSSYSYQIQSVEISHKLGTFFYKDSNNCIEFWDCSYTFYWIRIPRVLTLSPPSLVNLLGISIIRVKAILPYHFGECPSKWQIIEGEIS